MVKIFWAHHSGCASMRYLRVNGLARPTDSTNRAQRGTRSLSAAGAWHIGLGVGAAGADSLAIGALGAAWALSARNGFGVVAGAEAGTGIEVTSPPPRRSFSRISTESMLTALRASTALSRATSTRIFLEA